MKLSEGWLREHLDTTHTFAHIAEVLTDIGLEVEEVEPPRHDLDVFESVQIVEARPHPHAQKLQVCHVRTGDRRTLTIVCGASNARMGLKGVLAPIGSVIPTSGLTIQPTDLRGVMSEGMLCSASELGIGEESEGIIELPEDALLGESFAVLSGLNEGVWDINVTPNRGDCLSVRGIARDLAAKGIGALRPPPPKACAVAWPPSLRDPTRPLPEACPMFARRWIRDLRPRTPTPLWLKRRLERVGLKSNGPVVDILQWLMWDRGHPMHAYDAQALSGDLDVRWAQDGEVWTGLNGQTYTLNAQDLVVVDSKKTVALAGVLGSLETACSETTTQICLEAAVFTQKAVARMGQRLMISTDARARFERGVDPLQVESLLDDATAWIIDLCGGTPSEATLRIHATPPAEAPPLTFDLQRFKNITGVTDVTGESCIDLLKRLGCSTLHPTPEASVWQVTPPSWRHDLKLPEDLIEEVLRLVGYDRIPVVTPQVVLSPDASDERLSACHRMRQTLAYQGYTEVVNWSLVDDQSIQNLGFVTSVSIRNPISQDLNVLRPSLIPQLLDQVRHNQVHGLKKVALFEIGPIFQGTGPQDQILCIAGVHTGASETPHWHHPSRAYDVFDLKADLWKAVEAWGLTTQRLQVTSGSCPTYYHPGQSGAFTWGPQNILGTFGALHPAQQKQWDLDAPLMLFELWIERWPIPPSKAFRSPWNPSPYPAVERDFCFVVDAQVRTSDLIRSLYGVDTKIIRSIQLFDLYEDPAWAGKQRSYAFRICLQSDTGTLTDAQIQACAQAIIQKVSQAWGGVLRGEA